MIYIHLYSEQNQKKKVATKRKKAEPQKKQETQKQNKITKKIPIKNHVLPAVANEPIVPIVPPTIIVHHTAPGPSPSVQQESYTDRDQIKFLLEHVTSENTRLSENNFKLMTMDMFKSSVNTASNDNLSLMLNALFSTNNTNTKK